MDSFSYLLSFIEGVLTFISPCILPLLPVYFFYLAGVSGEGDFTAMTGTRRMTANSVGFVIGFSIVFVIMGATATSIGGYLKSNLDIFRKVSGIVMIAFGLNFTGILKLGFMNFEKRFNYEFKEIRFFNSIIFGMVFGFGWTPCLGAFLGSALLMAGNSDTLAQGILLLLVYSAGLGLPFILTAVLFEKVRNAFSWIQKYNRIINIISGIVLTIAGILTYTNNLQFLGTLSW